MRTSVFTKLQYSPVVRAETILHQDLSIAVTFPTPKRDQHELRSQADRAHNKAPLHRQRIFEGIADVSQTFDPSNIRYYHAAEFR